MKTGKQILESIWNADSFHERESLVEAELHEAEKQGWGAMKAMAITHIERIESTHGNDPSGRLALARGRIASAVQGEAMPITGKEEGVKEEVIANTTAGPLCYNPATKEFTLSGGKIYIAADLDKARREAVRDHNAKCAEAADAAICLNKSPVLDDVMLWFQLRKAISASISGLLKPAPEVGPNWCDMVKCSYIHMSDIGEWWYGTDSRYFNIVPEHWQHCPICGTKRPA